MTNNQTDKVAMITGATNGIGLATAYALANLNMELYLVCRNPKKAERIISDIKSQSGNRKLKLLICDLSSLEDVRKVAKQFQHLNKPLHLLVNNAGVLTTNRKLSKDGYEEMFAVNHLSHFLLTNLLLSQIKLSEPSRIVNVASGAHILVKRINFNDINFVDGFKSLKVYSHSKLANILFIHELAKRLNGTKVTVNAVDPGEVSTALGQQNGGIAKLLYWMMKPFIQTAEKGAKTTIYTCVSPEIEGMTGKYFRNCQEKEPKKWAKDDEAARQLWDISSKMVEL